MNQNNKHSQYMSIARHIAQTLSKDKTRKIGCLLIGEHGQPLAWGYNGFPRGADDDVPERHQHPLKLKWSEHAERNAIYNATRAGVCLLNSVAYICTLLPCVDCARGLVQVGVKEVFVEKSAFNSQDWVQDWPLVQEIFEECEVKTHILD